jgi:hypothetical protein
MWRILVLSTAGCLFLQLLGCSRGPSRVKPPDIDPTSAASEAIRLYDANSDGALDETELTKCPAILLERKTYDVDANGRITQEEIAARIAALRKNRVGLTGLSCHVKVNGLPLKNASVDFEPEPYLGTDIKSAHGVTDDTGIAQMAIRAEDLPQDQQDLKAIHYGTYKVRVTHSGVKIPTRYNTETTLGYETRIGDPYATFALKVP